jgi:hypothetical protein
MRATIRRQLTRYGYPPDKQLSAIELVMHQAELLAVGHDVPLRSVERSLVGRLARLGGRCLVLGHAQGLGLL